jgi:hypothetical protein
MMNKLYKRIITFSHFCCVQHEIVPQATDGSHSVYFREKSSLYGVLSNAMDNEKRVQYTKRGMRDVVNNQDVDKYTKNIAVCER